MTSPSDGSVYLLFAIAWALSLVSMLRLRQELEKAAKDRRWREALDHVRTGRMSMETLVRRSIQGRVGRP